MAAATPIAAITKPGQYVYTPVTVTWTVADVSNGNSFVADNRTTLHAKNTNAATTPTVTVVSVVDAYGRTRNIGPITLQNNGSAGDEIVFQRFNPAGFASGGLVTVTSSTVDVSLWLEQEPV